MKRTKSGCTKKKKQRKHKTRKVQKGGLLNPFSILEKILYSPEIKETIKQTICANLSALFKNNTEMFTDSIKTIINDAISKNEEVQKEMSEIVKSQIITLVKNIDLNDESFKEEIKKIQYEKTKKPDHEPINENNKQGLLP